MTDEGLQILTYARGTHVPCPLLWNIMVISDLEDPWH